MEIVGGPRFAGWVSMTACSDLCFPCACMCLMMWGLSGQTVKHLTVKAGQLGLRLFVAPSPGCFGDQTIARLPLWMVKVV